MASPAPTDDLLDLRMLPAWANEPARPNEYADFQGEDSDPSRQRSDRPRRPPGNRQDRGRRPDRADRSGGSKDRPNRDSRSGPPRDPRRDRGALRSPRPEAAPEPLAVDVRFLPHQRAFENVIAQIKSSS